MDGRLTRGRCRIMERLHCIISLRQQIFKSKKWESNTQHRRTIHILFVFCSLRFAECGPNHHATNPSLFHSKLVEDISGCPEDDRSDLAKDHKDALDAKHYFRSISGSFTCRHHVMNR